jgi:PI3-kinase family, ras-binding domain
LKVLQLLSFPLATVTYFCAENETADQLTERVFQKNYAKKLSGKTAADFMLKVKHSKYYYVPKLIVKL